MDLCLSAGGRAKADGQKKDNALARDRGDS
jgi:hypothetical protein